jgi:translation initiation factor 4E
VNYEEGIKKIGAFASVESFWSLWTHLYPPSELLPTTDYLLFHESVRRPVWEDPLNIAGGKWIVRLRKGVADRLWEDLVLALVGDQFAHVGEDADVPEICGATISVRQNEDIVSVWNRVEADKALRERIRCVALLALAWACVDVRSCVRVKEHNPTCTGFAKYDRDGVQDEQRCVFQVCLAGPPCQPTDRRAVDSMQDKSSFRTPALSDRTPLS